MTNENKNFTKKNLVLKGINITKEAAHYIASIIERNPSILGIEISIKNFGCAGMTYIFKELRNDNYIDQEYILYEKNKAKVYINLKNIHILDGSEIDYISKDLNKFLKIENPNVKQYCGCGSSFDI